MKRKLKIEMAPLQGFADQEYRALHQRLYGGVDVYYTPFVRLERGELRRQDLTRLKATLGDGTNTVAQIIFNSVEEFKALSARVKEIGFRRIDLNLGCPHAMQTGKGRGAALIGRPEVMGEVSKLINEDKGAEYSVKMRLGMRDREEWKGLIGILNGTRLEQITVHPRLASQMYGGEVDMEMFGQFVEMTQHRVVYNGDIKTTEEIEEIGMRYGKVERVMIGRGLLGRPSLGVEWISGETWGRERRIEMLLAFHEELLGRYEATLCGETQILQKIKPFWEYLEWEIGRKAAKGLSKATTMRKYREALGRIEI